MGRCLDWRGARGPRSSPPWPLGWASTASVCRGQGGGCPQIPRPSCQVGGFQSQEPGGTPSSLLVPLSSLSLFPPTSRELQGDTCRLPPTQPGRSPRASVSPCGDRCPSSPPCAPRLVGRGLEVVGGCGEVWGRAPECVLSPPSRHPAFPRLPRTLRWLWRHLQARVIIIDDAGSVPWRFAGPSPPAFLKVEASSLVASPHPGPWCPSHPRQTRPEGELVREGGGGQALVSPPSPLRRPQFPVELGEFLLDLLPVSPSPGPGPLVSPGCLETPHYRPRPSPLRVEASSWSSTSWGTTGVPYARATSWGGGGPGDLEAPREVVGGEGWFKGWERGQRVAGWAGPASAEVWGLEAAWRGMRSEPGCVGARPWAASRLRAPASPCGQAASPSPHPLLCGRCGGCGTCRQPCSGGRGCSPVPGSESLAPLGLGARGLRWHPWGYKCAKKKAEEDREQRASWEVWL